MKKIKIWLWGKVYLLFFRPIYMFWHTNLGSMVTNLSAKKIWRLSKSKPLSKIQRRILEDLRNDGIAITTLDELFGLGGKKLLRELLDYANFDSAPYTFDDFKPYIKNFWNNDTPFASMENPFMRIILSEEILSIVCNYLGMAPKLQEATLTQIDALKTGSEKTRSMRWHRDPNDRNLCKIFIYLADVNSKENGPLTYLKKSNIPNKYSKLFPQKSPSGIYPPDNEVEKNIDLGDIVECLGKTGTLIFADTSGLHRGGFVTSGYRRIFNAGLLPYNSYMKKEVPLKLSKLAMTPLQKFVLEKDDVSMVRGLYFLLKKKLYSENADKY